MNTAPNYYLQQQAAFDWAARQHAEMMASGRVVFVAPDIYYWQGTPEEFHEWSIRNNSSLTIQRHGGIVTP